jgi:hypothetical protein
LPIAALRPDQLGKTKKGEGGVFGGGVGAKDTDAAGTPCYARAAEHELYEVTVSVYHATDANALRACPSHLKTFRSGWRFRAFLARQPYRSAEIFNQGYRYAEQQPLGHAFRENDTCRWVLLAAHRRGLQPRQVQEEGQQPGGHGGSQSGVPSVPAHRAAYFNKQVLIEAWALGLKRPHGSA